MIFRDCGDPAASEPPEPPCDHPTDQVTVRDLQQEVEVEKGAVVCDQMSEVRLGISGLQSHHSLAQEADYRARGAAGPAGVLHTPTI